MNELTWDYSKKENNEGFINEILNYEVISKNDLTMIIIFGS